MKILEYIRTHKNSIIAISSVVLAFVFGFGIAYASMKRSASMSIQANNNPITNYNQYKKEQNPPTIDASCPVKAKKSTKGKQVYHVAGDPLYTKLKDPQCFQSEADAEKAGFQKRLQSFKL